MFFCACDFELEILYSFCSLEKKKIIIIMIIVIIVIIIIIVIVTKTLLKIS